VGEVIREKVWKTEWSLNPKVVPQVWGQLHRPMVDLFATNKNAVLPLYFSPVPDPLALGTDALFHSWDQLDAYAFPPWDLLPTVVRKIERSRCRILLVAPMWVRRSWFPSLCLMSDQEPLKLPLRNDLLVQGTHRDAVYPDLEVLDLHVWILSGPLSSVESCRVPSLPAF
jgi:hypothetical protein